MTVGGFWDLLSESEQGALSALGRHSVFPRGATICVEGDPVTHLYVLLEGWVKVFSVTRDGQELLVALRGQGETVGEVAGEANGYRTATVRTGSLVRSLIVGHDRFSSFLDSYPGAGRAYRHMITQRWNETSAMLVNRATTSAAQRLAALLIDLAARYGVPAGSTVDIGMPLSQDELASLAGSSRATVTRSLAEWRRRGLIQTGHRHFTIISMDGLRKIVGS
jgi:CRP/FNR family transcriptional regulator, cyclic AMP receptor protein